MSIYILKKDGKYHMFVLKDEYHHTFLRTLNDADFPEKVSNGIKYQEVIDINEDELVYSIAEQFQNRYFANSRKRGTGSLWWSVDAETKRCRVIPQY